jgi:hypothetical protein
VSLLSVDGGARHKPIILQRPSFKRHIARPTDYFIGHLAGIHPQQFRFVVGASHNQLQFPGTLAMTGGLIRSTDHYRIGGISIRDLRVMQPWGYTYEHGPAICNHEGQAPNGPVAIAKKANPITGASLIPRWMVSSCNEMAVLTFQHCYRYERRSRWFTVPRACRDRNGKRQCNPIPFGNHGLCCFDVRRNNSFNRSAFAFHFLTLQLQNSFSASSAVASLWG